MSADDTDNGLTAAKPPLGLGAAPLLAQLLALLLIALGVVGIHDVLARTGLVSQDPIIEGLLGGAGTLTATSPAVLTAAIVVALVGLVLLGAAVRRRPRTTLELRAATGVRIRRRDLPKLLRGDLETVDGVTSVDVTASGRKVTVVAGVLVRDERRAEVREELQRRATDALSALERSPRVKIKMKESSR